MGEQRVERRRADVVEGGEHGYAPDWIAIEAVRGVRAPRVPSELLERVGTAAQHDDSISRGLLVPDVRTEFVLIHASSRAASEAATSTWPCSISWAYTRSRVSGEWPSLAATVTGS